MAVLSLAMLGAFATTAGAVGDPRQTDLLTIGPAGGNANLAADWGGISDNGSHFFFTTSESLTPDDTDGGYQDVYERFGTTTTLVSAGGNGAFDAYYKGCSTDGLHVFFETDERLAGTDTDSTQDVYDRFNGTTTQISLGPIGGNGAQDAFFVDNSADGNRVFFESYEQLTTNDTDSGYRDVYQRQNQTTTTLLSIGPIGGGGNFGAQLDGITPDGLHAYIHTDEALTTNDTDGGAQDIYDRIGSSVTRVSTGSLGGNAPNTDAFFEGSSASGSHVFFTTPEQLESGDTDNQRDAYDRSGGTTTLLSTGPNGGNGPYSVIFGGSTTDGSKVWFQTREALVSGDTDSGCTEQNVTVPCLDVYERTSSGTTWVSTGGNGSNDALFAAGSADGKHVYFHTTESLDAADTDGGFTDVYERSDGTTTSFISSGANGPHAANLGGISSDGTRVFFYSYESLVPEDQDGSWLDVYEGYGGQTTLLSTGPASANQQEVAFFAGSTADGTKAFFFTSEAMVSGDTDTATDVYVSASLPTPGFPRPKGATPMRVALVPGYQECTGGNRQHGGPLNVLSCNPPNQSSSVLTVGTMDANGLTPQSVGSVRYIVKPGDFQITASLTDVRCRATNAACPGGPLSAYTGKVLVQSSARITDKYNGSPANESATTEDFPLQAPVSCAFVSSTIGGACNLTTTMNALVLGAVTAGQRANWELGNVEVLDAGPNGTGFGAGCPQTCGDGDEGVFMRQGIWVP